MPNLPTAAATPVPPPPKPLAGFESINRYWDRGRETFAAKILPGEYYVTRGGEMITTILGSCVSACIRDTVTGLGGMNHFMLPVQETSGQWGNTFVDSATRYGNVAMEHLINDILKRGGRRENFEIKLFGGGKVLTAMTDIGRRNIEFVTTYLLTEGLRAVSADLGGLNPRKVIYYPDSGKVLVKKLRSIHNDTIAERERKYLQDLDRQPVTGEIDLF